MICAFESGAREILPVGSLDEARIKRSEARDALLCGERHHERPEDFDLGNSPAEFLCPRVGNKRLIHSTTNGTKAFLAMQMAGVPRVLLGSFRNLSALADYLSETLSSDSEVALIIAASGTLDGASYEDLLFGAALLHQMDIPHPLVSLWRARPSAHLHDCLAQSRNGRALLRLGKTDDIKQAAMIDQTRIVPCLHPDGWLRPDPPWG